MNRLSLSQAWEQTRTVLVRDGRLFVSVALALVVLPQTVIGLIAPSSAGQASALTVASLAITLVLGFVAQIALNRLAIGPSTTVGASIGRGFARMPALLGSSIILLIALFIILIPIVLLLGATGLVVEPGAKNEAPGSLLFVILIVVALCYAIFQLTIPVAAAEDGGPIHLIKRSWHLGRGHYWRLLAFVVVVFIGLLVVLLAGQFGLGSMITVALGPPDPLSLSALVISLVVSVIQAAFTILFAVMLARIFTQLASGAAQSGVPRSGI